MYLKKKIYILFEGFNMYMGITTDLSLLNVRFMSSNITMQYGYFLYRTMVYFIAQYHSYIQYKKNFKKNKHNKKITYNYKIFSSY